MPLVKRNVEPRHLCQGAVPKDIGGELEYVTNNSLSAIIRQLSCLMSLHDINTRKAFRSSTHQDQQVVSKSSAPSALDALHTASEPPPPLGSLTAYR
ncbi:hypothetical protein CRUP_028683 [Coryphaenoides rupestris]|nr:hypothetical protein CRUP_028683 [Coryphaenoides rupestris]